MEIVIGVILLVGAFALGHNQEALQAQARLESEQAEATAENGILSQDCRYRVSGPVRRDLTVPYNRQRRAERTGSESTQIAYRSE